MIRPGLAVALLALCACAPDTPDSNPDVRGVGFSSYDEYRTYRAPPPERVTTVVPPPAAVVVATAPPAATPAPGPVAPVSGPVAAVPGPVAAPERAGISDEQNFAAVSERETIESDAARLKAQREAFVQVRPTAVPTRTGADAANVVEYALTTSHPVGTKVYTRFGLRGAKRAERNCRSYASADLAQEAFLKAGGPGRDRLGLDPDGDGYACGWDPTPFRRIAG